MKHLEVDYHYVRDKVVRKELQVCYTNTVDQVANVFTKGLSSFYFKQLAHKLMVRRRTISLQERDSRAKSSSDEAT